MKKQYDVTKLTDELSKSVFFQEPKKAPKHQVTKALSNESAKVPSNQSAINLNDQSTQEPSIQPAQETKQQSTLALKHFSSYLQPGTYKAWKLLATEREKKDYEILQEAMEQYLERLKE